MHPVRGMGSFMHHDNTICLTNTNQNCQRLKKSWPHRFRSKVHFLHATVLCGSGNPRSLKEQPSRLGEQTSSADFKHNRTFGKNAFHLDNHSARRDMGDYHVRTAHMGGNDNPTGLGIRKTPHHKRSTKRNQKQTDGRRTYRTGTLTSQSVLDSAENHNYKPLHGDFKMISLKIQECGFVISVSCCSRSAQNFKTVFSKNFRKKINFFF